MLERVSSRAGRPPAVSRQPRFAGDPPNTFAVFGEGLRSAISFPELPGHENGRVAWALHLAQRRDMPPAEHLLGVLPNVPCRVELHRAGVEGFILSHSCTGVFDIGSGGAEIRFASHAASPLDLIRADILGRVLPLALHMRGVLSLHASAVALSEGAIAFVAPKGFGKSTLALSLAQAGAKFVTDDVLPVHSCQPFTVNPGVQSVRLPNDLALGLIDDVAGTRLGIDGKRIVDRLPRDMVAGGASPLVALYVLTASRNASGTSPIRRSRLASRQSVLQLLRHAKVAALLGGNEAPKVFQQAASIAAAVPAFSLEIARDLHRLPDAVAAIGSWHGGASVPTR